MSVTEAALFHMEKMDISENLFNLANRSLNPSTNQIRWLRSSWVRRNVGGFDQHSMVEMLDEYCKQNPEITIKVCWKLRTYIIAYEIDLTSLTQTKRGRGDICARMLTCLGPIRNFKMVANLHALCSMLSEKRTVN